MPCESLDPSTRIKANHNRVVLGISLTLLLPVGHLDAKINKKRKIENNNSSKCEVFIAQHLRLKCLNFLFLKKKIR